MPLDPIKLQQVLDRGDQLTKRFDALTARRAKADEEKAQRKADRARRDAEQLTSEEAEAIASPTPDRFLLNNPDILDQPKDLPDPWYYTDLELGYEHEREETRTGALSKDRG
jgi:hypothetical protein